MKGGSQQSMGGNEGDETPARQKQKATAFRTGTTIPQSFYFDRARRRAGVFQGDEGQCWCFPFRDQDVPVLIYCNGCVGDVQ